MFNCSNRYYYLHDLMEVKMKIEFKNYKPGIKYGEWIYSKTKIKHVMKDSANKEITVVINPNTEFNLLKTDDGQIIVERNKNGIRLLWEITLEELNKYFKMTRSKADTQKPIEIQKEIIMNGIEEYFNEREKDRIIRATTAISISFKKH